MVRWISVVEFGKKMRVYEENKQELIDNFAFPLISVN